MSQPPGDSPADESSADEPVARPPGSGDVEEHDDPGSTRNDASPTTGSAPHEQASPHGAAPVGASAPPPPPPGQEPPPWWAQGQGPPPPPGVPQQPPPHPFQAPPPPWAYGRQGPPPVPAPNLAGPAGRPPSPDASAGRDRLSVHLIWEGVLAFIAVVLMIVTAVSTDSHNISVALGQAGYIGLLSVGLAFSLRTGSPNLAVGTILSFTATLAAYLVTEHQWSKPAALLLAILLATLMGLVLGVVAATLSVPSWAVTLAAGAVFQAIVIGIARGVIIPLPLGGSYSTAMWYGIFGVVSVAGGALWLVPAVRTALSTGRRTGDPAEWTGPRNGLGVIVGLTGSSFLAAVAAVPMLLRLQAAVPDGGSLTTSAFAAVLLGGVSVFGRRAGVFGTLLGVTIIAVVEILVAYNEGPIWLSPLLVGLAALLGLGVTRAIESITDSLDRARPANPVPPRMGPPSPVPPPHLPPPPPVR